MPIDPTASNSIINAFMSGHQAAFENQRRLDELNKEQLAREFEQKQLAEHMREFDKSSKDAQARFDAEQAIRESQNRIATLNAKQAIVENYQKGLAIPGLTEQSYDPNKIGSNVNIGAGPAQMNTPGPGWPFYNKVYGSDIITNPKTVTVSHPDLGTFNIPTREAAATTQAGIQKILMGPSVAAKIQEELAKIQVENAKQENQYKFQGMENEKNRQNAYAIALLRSNATNDPLKKLEIWNYTPVSTEEAERYGVPAGTLHKDIVGLKPGIKLTPSQEDKLTYLKSMLQDAHDAQILLDPKYDGIGYDKYFFGKAFSLMNPSTIISGLPSEILAKAKGESDETQAMIRNKLGNVFDKRKVESAGKVLNAAELKLLQNYVPPYEHSINPVQAKANLEEFIKGTSTLIHDLETQYGNRTINPGVRDTKGTINKTLVPSEKGNKPIDLNQFIVPAAVPQ